MTIDESDGLVSFDYKRQFITKSKKFVASASLHYSYCIILKTKTFCVFGITQYPAHFVSNKKKNTMKRGSECKTVDDLC